MVVSVQEVDLDSEDDSEEEFHYYVINARETPVVKIIPASLQLDPRLQFTNQPVDSFFYNYLFFLTKNPKKYI